MHLEKKGRIKRPISRQIPLRMQLPKKRLYLRRSHIG